MQEISIENYLKKKSIQRENMEEIGIKLCLKKEKTKTKRIPKQIFVEPKNKHKKFFSFFLIWYKNGTKILDFW